MSDFLPQRIRMRISSSRDFSHEKFCSDYFFLLLPAAKTRDQCYDFLNIFAEKIGKKLAFFAQNKAKLFKNWIITLVFEKNAIFFAEN
jgi:hypothetical protein